MAEDFSVTKTSSTHRLIDSVNRGNLSEIYLSLQGEGLWVGIAMVFVRTTGCHRRCSYCDSEYTHIAEKQCRIYQGWRDGLPNLLLNNPVKVDQTLEFIQKISNKVTKWVVFTGGEPLLQAEFLATLGAKLNELGFKILLETEGGLPHRLQKVLPYLHAVSADIKLPSTTGEPIDWDTSEQFFQLLAKSKVEYCAKIVVTPNIDEAEFIYAVKLLERLPSPTPTLIIQPVTPARFVTEPPSHQLLLHLVELAQQCLSDVRVVPQVHKLINLA